MDAIAAPIDGQVQALTASPGQTASNDPSHPLAVIVDLAAVKLDATIHLGPDDVLLLYTDGVTEARTPGGLLGEEGLADALRTAPPTANGVVEAIERRAVEVQGGQPRDDIAVVAAAVPA